MNLKRYFPASLRLKSRLLLRKSRDIASGTHFKLARSRVLEVPFTDHISLTQPIMVTTHFENKVHNIRQGMMKVSQVIILPGEIFSFWNAVKEPCPENNYKVGRNVIAGKLSEDYGGGLCQLSSIIYHISLIAGLQVVERYNHSVDIYREHERFTPLGADATVVYGYKDLRIKNNYPFPLKYTFSIFENQLTCRLYTTSPLESRELLFERENRPGSIMVYTRDHSRPETRLVANSFYQKP